MGINDQVEQCY